MVLQSAAFAGEALFRNHSVPMWIYDLESLAFLEVNDAAIARYGWSRDEFLSMTIADIRPAEDLPALRENLSRVGDGLDRAGVWRHRLKSGRIIHVEIVSHALACDGRRAEMVSAHDVTPFVDFERAHAALISALPGSFVVLTPDDHRILAVSEPYRLAIGVARADLVARRLFELVPDRPDATQAEAILALRASLERAARTGNADQLELPCHPLRSVTSVGARAHAGRWRASCHPVRTGDGMMRWLVHRLDPIESGPVLRCDDGEEGSPGIAAEQQDGEGRLVELARRLLGIGTWRLDLDSGELRWSEDVYRMYGVEPNAFGHSFADYVECVHPDDREPMRVRYAEFLARRENQFSFEHRIVRSDGSIGHVRGVGELGRSVSSGRILTGIVQDITSLLESDARLSETTNLLRLAGRAARLGGWRVDLAAERVHWSAETAAIHEEPEGTSPDLDTGIRYYAPEFRDRVRTVFGQCAETGRGFDEVLQLVTARGRRIWVRAIGEAVRDAQGRIVAVQGAFQDIDELMAAQARSAELSRRLAETLEHISDAFFTLDQDWNFSFLNSQAERLLDRPREDLVGRNVWVEFPGAVGSTFQREYERAVSTRQTARFSEYYDPLQTHFEVNAYPAPDGLAVYFRDVTKERERTEQLRLLEAAIARVNDILVITDAESIDRPHGPRIVFVNEAFVRKTGYSREYAIGKTPRFLQGARTQRSELARIRSALAEGRPVRAELVNYTRSREEIWLELDIVPVIDDRGRRTHWVSVERDVTGRKLAEQALRASEERFRLVAQATNDVVWDWDLVHDVVWWNESMSSVFGHDRSRLEPGPASWMNRVHAEDRERVVHGIHAVIGGAGANWTDEYRFLRADGSAAIVVDRGFVIRDESGRAIRMLGSMTDMSSRRELDERLKQAQRLEAVGQLTGGVAHDFNNLLTVILGNAEILREQLTDQQQLRMLAEMTATAAARGAELTRRLLAFARRQPLEPRRVNVNELLGAMDSLLRRAVSEDIDIELVRGGGLWLTEIDPVQLESALLNLALNARDAMPDGGRLTIETANASLDDLYASLHEEVDPGQYVMISVSDTGAGMTREVVARAFDPFFTTKAVGKGSGLGLSMVYGFVKQSGGHAKIYTEPGEGTTVRLYLPRARAGALPSSVAVAGITSVGGGEHILVVEDDDLVRGHLVAQLEGLGYRVTATHDGPSALEIIGRMADDLDLLFTDVVMPGGMNGRELADAARVIRADLRVLFTSGYTENAIVHQGRLDRGVHLLGKPYRRQELAAKVRKVLDEG